MRQIEILRKLYRGRLQPQAPSELAELTGMQEQLALSELKSSGITFLHDIVPAEITDAIRNKIDDLLNKVGAKDWQQVVEEVKVKEKRFGINLGQEWLYWTDAFGSDRRIIHSEKASELISGFAFNEVLSNIGSAYLDKRIELKFCMANRTQFKPENTGSGGGWHRDNNYRRGYKALLYLVDTDAMNGCFQYLKKSSSIYHHLIKTPKPDKYQFTHEEIMHIVNGDESQITNATGKAGTVILFDTNGIHRGKPIEPEGSRYALTNYYID
ncbi:MAG: phytanoyl-CoA dioxygenase family protein [Flavobacteriales bacterium]